jgi:hypothetical protein
MQDSFHEIEEEFLRLRGMFAVGIITAEEFDAALQELQVEDEEGRVWMIGANTGRWYYTTSPEWVEGDPVQAASSPSDTDSVQNIVFSNQNALVPVPDSPDTSDSSQELATWEDKNDTQGSRKLALVFVGISVALLVIAAISLGVLNTDNLLFASANSSLLPTRILPRIAASNPSENQSAATVTPTRQVQAFATSIPVTPTPALVIEPTSTAPALTVIPTITPNRNPGKPSEPKNSLPPAVYVTGIRVSPNPPPRQGSVTFTASFWNTNRESVPMNWWIILLDPNKPGRNKDYGASQFEGITVPPGRTEYSITFTPVNSEGPCLLLQAFAARRQDDNSRVYLLGTSGSPFGSFHTFC